MRNFWVGLIFIIRLPYRVFQKTDPLVYFDDNFGKYRPILIIFSLLQQEIYEAQKLSYFSHLTFIMFTLPSETNTDAEGPNFRGPRPERPSAGL